MHGNALPLYFLKAFFACKTRESSTRRLHHQECEDSDFPRGPLPLPLRSPRCYFTHFKSHLWSSVELCEQGQGPRPTGSLSAACKNRKLVRLSHQVWPPAPCPTVMPCHYCCRQRRSTVTDFYMPHRGMRARHASRAASPLAISRRSSASHIGIETFPLIVYHVLNDSADRMTIVVTPARSARRRPCIHYSLLAPQPLCTQVIQAGFDPAMANKGTAPLSAKVGPVSKRPKSSGSEIFARSVLEFLMGLFPSASQESLTSDVVATVHAIIFLLMQNVNIYRLNFHSWNFHVFALSLLLLSRVLVSHWMLRMRRRDDIGSQHWWIRLVVPISFVLNYLLLIERIRSISLWTSLTLGTHATLCFAPLPWNSDSSLGMQLNARLRSLMLDGFNIFLLSSVYPMLFVRDQHLYYDKTRCFMFAFICLLSCAAVSVTRACISAYLPFLTKGGSLGSWLPKADIKTSASGKFSLVKY